MQPLPVALTLDIEFDVNRAFETRNPGSPRGREAIHCLFNGQDIGLGAILDILDDYGVRATFFVETLNTAWFGPDEMRDIAQELHARGHEVQLHVHPVWLHMDEVARVASGEMQAPETFTHDSLANLSENAVVDLVRIGQSTFAEWGLPPATAIRAGNLMIARHVYRAFAACGLTISSSVGMGVYRPPESELHRLIGPMVCDDVLEMPVSSYYGADVWLRSRVRLATLIGMSMAEQKGLLNAAQDLPAPGLIFLSHVNEVCHSLKDGSVVPNLLTVRKLRQLCESVSSSPMLDAVTISELASRWRGRIPAEDYKLELPRGLGFTRLLERLER
tara:strand:- start:31204 stop:32199 length:996 start_codon:yes stop_codon:yes gene_type:complete